MAFRTKPDFSAVWASLGDNTKPVDSYITNGWETVKPPRQYFNWIDNRQDAAIAYLYQAGVPEWDALVDYEGGAGVNSYSQGSDGKIYRCLADNGPNIVSIGAKDPTNPLNSAFWQVAFATKSDYDALAATVATHTTQIGNGSGVTNAPAWRTALSVDSSAQVDAKIAAAVGGGLIAVASGAATNGTKNRDLLGNITIDSFTKDTGLNTGTWVISLSGLATALTASNFVVNANGYNLAFNFAAYTDADTFTLTGYYADNAADATNISMGFTVFMAA